jgi:hypothetical protein
LVIEYVADLGVKIEGMAIINRYPDRCAAVNVTASSLKLPEQPMGYFIMRRTLVIFLDDVNRNLMVPNLSCLYICVGMLLLMLATGIGSASAGEGVFGKASVTGPASIRLDYGAGTYDVRIV